MQRLFPRFVTRIDSTQSHWIMMSYWNFFMTNVITESPLPKRPENRVSPSYHVKNCLPCFSVFSGSHFLWLIILWYAVAQSMSPTEMNKQSFGDLQATRAVGLCLLRCDTFSERPLFFVASLCVIFCFTLKEKFWTWLCRGKKMWFSFTALSGRLKASSSK